MRSHFHPRVVAAYLKETERMASCLAKSVVLCSAARPAPNGKGKAVRSSSSKLWTPKSAAVESPMIMVEGDAESKMAGLTAKRREVILDMEDFAENEVRHSRGTRASREGGQTSSRQRAERGGAHVFLSKRERCGGQLAQKPAGALPPRKNE